MAGVLQKLVEEDFGISGRGKWLHSEEHDSLVINSEEDKFFWNSTGQRGNAFDYLVDVRGMTKKDAREFLKSIVGGFSNNSEQQTQIVAYDKLVDAFWINGKNNRDYWYKRCLTDDTIDRYKLGYYEGWSTIPIYDGGDFVDIQLRRDEPEKIITKWYKTGKVFLFGEPKLQYTKTIYITEGLVDSILLNQEGFTSVSAGGVNTWQDEWFVKFMNIETIYYLEDNDQAGRIGARRVASSLGKERVKIVSFTGMEDKYDTGDWFRNGGTKETFKEYVESNSKYLFELEGAYERTARKFHKVPKKVNY